MGHRSNSQPLKKFFNLETAEVGLGFKGLSELLRKQSVAKMSRKLESLDPRILEPYR